MELDTGATVSIMGKQVFDTLFPELQIHPSSMALKTYTGEPMEVLSEATVSVTYQQQRAQELPLVIVRGTGPTLLGRNWLHQHQARLRIYLGCVATPEVSRQVAGEISGHL